MYMKERQTRQTNVPEFRARAAMIDRDVALVSVAGELDLYTADSFALALEDAIATRPAAVIVDLSATTFVDSTALGVLVHRAKSLGRAQLAIVPGAAHAQRLFDVTGLARVYSIYSTLAAAIAACVAEPEAA